MSAPAGINTILEIVIVIFLAGCLVILIPGVLIARALYRTYTKVKTANDLHKAKQFDAKVKEEYK